MNTSSSVTHVGISVYRNRHACTGGACRKVPVIAGNTIQTVDATDAHIDRRPRDGYVHGTLRLHDHVTNADLAVRADVAWIASAPPVCASLHEVMPASHRVRPWVRRKRRGDFHRRPDGAGRPAHLAVVNLLDDERGGLASAGQSRVGPTLSQ